MHRRLFFLFVISAGLLLLPTATLSATTWIGLDLGDWNTPGNWDAGVPTAGVEAWINNGTTAVLDTSGPAGAASNVYVGHGGTGNSGLNISNDLTASGYMAVGLSNDVPGSVAGTVNQSAGTVNVATMYIGNTYSFDVATAGVYNMTGGSLNVTTGPFRVGWYGGGTFDQSGGVVTSSSDLDIGTGGSSATVTVRGTASMTVPDILMCGPSSTLNVQGGTLNVPGAIWLAYYSVSTNSVINQSGGTVTTAGFASTGGTDIYNLSGGEMNLTYGPYVNPITTFVMTDGGGGGGRINIVSGSSLQADNTYDLQAGTVNGILAGDVGLTKTTPGTVTLIGENTYTGLTSVEEGTLKVSGSIVGEVVAAAGSTLEPGASIGTMSTGKLTLAGTLLTEYGGDGATPETDVLTVNGDLDLSAGTFDFAPYGSLELTEDSYIFLNYTGDRTGEAAVVTAHLPAGYHVEYDVGGGQNVALVVPEPSTLVLLVLGLLGVAAYMRRRREA
jgi:autotransporter-associated beta strand protein